MAGEATPDPNVRQTAPFLAVSDMKASVAWYVDGLGFEITHRWEPDGELRWCWLQRGGGALMLQQFRTTGPHAWTPAGQLGEGVTIYFICTDALAIYREVTARGVRASIPVVGNGMWVTELCDPDGYRLGFESQTDVPEETVFSEAGGEPSPR